MSTILSRSLVLLNRCSSQTARKIRCMNTSSVLCDSSSSMKIPKKPKPFKIKPLSWTNIAITSTVGGVLLAYMYYLKEKKDNAIERERRRELGKAAIGGKFELLNPEKKVVKSEDFLGQWVMLYFGFTHCPDVCPDELEKLTKVVNTLEKEHKLKVQPIFISVDPDRDTPEVVGQYVKEFSDKIIGLTGSTEQVAQACKAYRVYFSNGPKDQDKDYIVDHTIIIYLVDPDGLFVDYYGLTHTAEQIVNSVVINKMKYDKVQNDTWLPSLPLKKSVQTA